MLAIGKWLVNQFGRWVISITKRPINVGRRAKANANTLIYGM